MSIKPKSTKIPYLITIIISLLFISSILITRKGGLIGHESQFLIFNYLDKRPTLTQIINPGNDWNYYQARELSYFFDFIDAKVIYFSSKLGFPHFYSFTNFSLLILIGLLLTNLAISVFKIKSNLVLGLLIAIFYSSPQIFFSGNYFRSAKILVFFFLLLLFKYIYKFISGKKLSKKNLFLIFLLSILMSISDRQGFFLLVAINILIFISYFALFDKRIILLNIILGLAAVFNMFYTYLLGPWIITLTTGLPPSLDYLKLDFYDYGRKYTDYEVYLNYTRLPELAKNSLTTIFYTFRNLLGNIGDLIAAIIAVLLSSLTYFSLFKNKFQKKGLITVIFFFTIFFLWLMNLLMGIKNNWIFWDEVVLFGYYFYPITAAIYFFIFFSYGQISSLWPQSKKFFISIFIIMLAFNISSIPKYFQTIEQSSGNQVFNVIEESRELLKCLNNPEKKIDSFSLSENKARICKFFRK